MIIKVIGSGSSGNGYLISDGHSQLIIECGISFKKFQTAVEFELGNLDGILISHEHRDHCKYISYYLHGTYADVYATKGTIDAMFQDRFLRLSIKKPQGSATSCCVSKAVTFQLPISTGRLY